MVMKANRRCSIRFHLLVPGGRWRDLQAGLVGEALEFALPQLDGRRCCRRIRRDGQRAAGDSGPDRALPPAADLSTAKLAVSGLIPTLTQPYRGEVVHAVGNRFSVPGIANDKVVHADAVGFAGSPPCPRPLFLKSPTNSFFRVCQ